MCTEYALTSSRLTSSECDTDGGNLKTTVDNIEVGCEDGFFDRALAIVLYAQQYLTKPNASDPDHWFKTGGKGVYRRFYHHIPVRGPHSIKRNICKAKDGGANIVLRSTTTPFPIGHIHRAITTGYAQQLYCSCRSCYSCASCKVGR